MERYIAVDNVCAWPNLTLMPDGRVIATIFNQPCHGHWEGDVECWESADGGRTWKLCGIPATHEPGTNRMNVAAGLAGNGDLIVIASGWSDRPPRGESRPGPKFGPNAQVLPSWVCRSSDGGRTWTHEQERFPAPEGDAGIVPFGKIIRQPPETLTIPGARVTHVCCTGDGGFTAEHVARCSLIPHVVEHPTDVIGRVDAVLIATDIGSEHVDRARPFIEAGVPVFIDKPLVESEEDLRTFIAWADAGRPFMSSSCMRYSKEFAPYRLSTHDLGKLRFVSITTCKSWERYAIHALEAIYPIMGPGFVSVRNSGGADRNIVHLKHRSGCDAVVAAISDMAGSFGCMSLCGTEGHAHCVFKDTFYAFRAQMEAFVAYLRTGIPPFPFAETVELMRVLIAGIRSREAGGREVPLSET